MAGHRAHIYGRRVRDVYTAPERTQAGCSLRLRPPSVCVCVCVLAVRSTIEMF